MFCILTVLFYALLIVSYSAQKLDFNRYNYATESQCTSNFILQVSSIIECAIVCELQHLCLSFFYKRYSSECTGCVNLLGVSGSPPNSDLLYFAISGNYGSDCGPALPCLEANTVCFTGIDRCVCRPQFMYDPKAGRCVSGCPVLGMTFQRYPEFALPGHNEASEYATGVEQCIQICASNVLPFVCYSIDYTPATKFCKFSNVAITDANYAPTYWSGVDLLIRNCD